MAGNETELQNQYDEAEKALNVVFKSQKIDYQDQIYRVLKKSKEFQQYVLTPSLKSVTEIEKYANFYNAYGMLTNTINDVSCTITFDLKTKAQNIAQKIAEEALALAKNPTSGADIKKLTVILQTTKALYLTSPKNVKALNNELLKHQAARQQLGSERKYAALRYVAAGFLLIAGFAAGFFTAGTSTIAGIYLAGMILGSIAACTAATHQTRKFKQYGELRTAASDFQAEMTPTPPKASLFGDSATASKNPITTMLCRLNTK